MLGLIGAMAEEVSCLQAGLEDVVKHSIGRREYLVGRLGGREVCLAFSRWGKVAAASTATTMIGRFDVSEIVFTGVAGGVSPRLQIGDVVVANELVQHDLDASPLFPRLEVPLLGTASFRPDRERSLRAIQACSAFLDDITRHVSRDELTALGIASPSVYEGTVASGDQFVSSQSDLQRIAGLVPGVLCVEMEGAAVAQVAYEHAIPFTVIRVISDSAAEGASHDFQRFVDRVASRYSAGIVRALLM